MANDLMQCVKNLIAIGDWEAAAFAYAAMANLLKRS